MMLWLDRLFAFCASLRLAVIVILALAGLLGVATFYEARYGIPAVQARVYGSNLFLAVMALLAVNVMAAALIRYPWKRKQTGFVVTHLGILVLLAGCLLSFRKSVDGRVALRPGNSSRQLVLISERIQVRVGEGTENGRGKVWTAPADWWAEAGYPSAARSLLPGWPEPRWSGPTPSYEAAPGVRVEVLDWLPASRLERSAVQSPEGTPTLMLTFAGTAPDGSPVHEEATLSVPTGETAVSRDLFGGLIEVFFRTAPDAAAVAAMPDPPPLDEASGLTRGRLLLVQTGDGRLYFRAYTRSGSRTQGEVTVGTEFARFLTIGATVTAHVPRGRLTETYVAARVAPNKMAGAMRAVKLGVTVDGRREEVWVARGSAEKPLATPRGPVYLAYGYDAGDLPFSVALVSARQTNNPGTNEPAAFESTVMVTQPDGTKLRQTITMNEPLTVEGYTFYQESLADLGGVAFSTLSVRKDPGTIPKYAGSGLICLGIFLMFYMKAYFQKPQPTPAGAAGELVGGAA